jgi:hypothetical protein
MTLLSSKSKVANVNFYIKENKKLETNFAPVYKCK